MKCSKKMFTIMLLILIWTTPAAADYAAGLAAFVKGDFVTACKEFKPLAEQGVAKAQLQLGEMYLNGRCKPQAGKEGAAEAAKWFRLAAEQGSIDARINLGLLYSSGTGVEKNEKETLNWYRKAADQGSSKAQWMIGYMHSTGLGMPKNDTEAFNWYRKSAMQGNEVGQRLLGELYGLGLGVKQDHVQAYMWLSLSIEGGDRYAAEIRYSFYKKMTPEQVSEAQKLAKEWRPVKEKKGK